MYRNKTVAVVVPAFNVQNLIGRVIETMPDFVDQMIVIDDKSTDQTIQIVESYFSHLGQRLTLIKNEINEGVGGAIAKGYKKALEKDFEIAVVMAGDAQMNPDDLPSL